MGLQSETFNMVGLWSWVYHDYVNMNEYNIDGGREWTIR